ncbi:MAG: hypothetical protein O3C04_03975 [Crenarchaeota archaeon]|nr:hypothetical protein [Thermoproteota archaeon]MDA1124787.1 hypothetical protein [Thermoproteota archaeon]
MNKIYGMITIFAFAGLLLPTSAMQVEAASDLDYMLDIAEKAKRYIKQNIDEMENSNTQDWKNRQAVLEIYKKSDYEIDQLSTAIKDGDVKSARELFLSSMSKIKQISQMLNQIAESKAQDAALPDHSQIIKRYEMNYQRLQQISDKIGADIDFAEMKNLISLAKQTNQLGESDKTKQTIDQVALKGLEIYKTLQSLDEKNKIIRAQALAEKYVDMINTLIVQAKTSGLLDHVNQLETTKTQLVSSNSTSQITKNIKIVITIHRDIQEINTNNLQQIDIDKIQLSQKQRITSELFQLETKAKLLYSEAKGSNAALYYVEKAIAIIDNVRNNLDNSEQKINSSLQLIKQLLTKAEKIVQESS